jgi:beta-xylosidase
MSKPIPMPKGEAVPHGFAFADDFSTSQMGRQWNFYDGDATDTSRYRYEHGSLVVKGKGTAPKDASPLSFVCGDQAYEVQVEMELTEGATAGVLVFYNSRLYAGLGYNGSHLILHRYGTERQSVKLADTPRRLFVRLRNDRHVVTMWYSADGTAWKKFDNQIEVSGYHHNVAYDFLSLRPALYAAGTGEVRFRNFTYRALP